MKYINHTKLGIEFAEWMQEVKDNNLDYCGMEFGEKLARWMEFLDGEDLKEIEIDQRFKAEVKAVFLKYNGDMDVDIQGDTHGLDVNIRLYRGNEKIHTFGWDFDWHEL